MRTAASERLCNIRYGKSLIKNTFNWNMFFPCFGMLFAVYWKLSVWSIIKRSFRHKVMIKIPTKNVHQNVMWEHELRSDFFDLWQGWVQRFWKRGALYVSHHALPTQKIIGLRWPKKAKITLETITFWQNISISIFKIFSIALYNESLLMKFYQFLKIYKPFDNEREKTLM